jgi:CRP-like cAMP-binding protein
MNRKEESGTNLDLLARIVLFKDFKDNAEVLGKIEGLFVEKRAHRGEVIIREGDVGDELFIIKKGSVRIEKTTLQNEPYTVVMLSEDQNVFFGEIGLLLHDKRSATVRAEEDSVFLVTDRRKFEKFGEDNPYPALLITRQIAQILSKRLFKTNQDVVTLFSALVSEIDASATAGVSGGGGE